MPGGDRTGPLGRGPMTGRAAGLCTGSSSPGYANNTSGRGLGRGLGRGFGRGFGRGIWERGRNFYRCHPFNDPLPLQYPNMNVTPSKEEEKTYLEETIRDLEQQIKSIRSRLSQLDDKKD